MNKERYKKIVKRNTKKDNYIHNYLIAFISGGLLGSLSEIIFIIIKNISDISNANIRSYISLFIILTASLLTSLGIFDNFIVKFRSGLIIPTTGFAHSVTSSAIDAKKEGLITGIGSNFFRLAGSVILYSIVTSFFLILIKVIINA